MARKTKRQYRFPLADDQVFGTQTIQQGRTVWSGVDVRRLNEALGLEGDVFTSQTREAVLKKQRTRKTLPVTGQVDRATWDAIVP